MGKRHLAADNYDQLSLKVSLRPNGLVIVFASQVGKARADVRQHGAKSRPADFGFLSHYYVTREGIELTEITHHAKRFKNQAKSQFDHAAIVGWR